MSAEESAETVALARRALRNTVRFSTALWIARRDFVAEVAGEPTLIRKGSTLPGYHALVREHVRHFDPLPPRMH